MTVTADRQASSKYAIYKWWRTHPQQVWVLPADCEQPKYLFSDSLHVPRITYQEWMMLRDADPIGRITLTPLRRLLTVRTSWSRKA